jgi:ribonuclease HI
MTEKRKSVELYTDGACSGNPGAGGWAAILRFGEHEKVLSGYMHHTTNNRMEVFAVISGLGALKGSCIVRVYSDSAYVINAFNQGWLTKWKSNGWKNAEGKDVENIDLWRLLLLVVKNHEVEFIKVAGHSDHPENNRCDEIAKQEIKKFAALNPDLFR